MAAALLQLSSNATLRDALGYAGRQRSREFSWETITARYLDAYAQAADRAAPRKSAGRMVPA